MNIANLILNSISLILEVGIRYFYITFPIIGELIRFATGKKLISVILYEKIRAKIKELKENKNE